ncbi:hypothetical protein N7508_002443 [Penicillium antarcticum]|uniref:uncharacterized protein n=1 Tax=Penicillium antarcticum TaxID=416450 RepID=UPI00239B560B|nr:uncharacterized protein N7508_002443 [Penicillium antarcticum]KAJ5317935.1 hypothetical protein N7508_002443 [Penicillium antarcticum]
MGYPSEQEIYDLFINLQDWPKGHSIFFDQALEKSTWTLTGHHPFSRAFPCKSAFQEWNWKPHGAMFAPPGPCFIVPNGLESVVCGSNGKVAIELRMVNTVTKCARLSYDQQYSWHCKFTEEGKIESVRIYLDSMHTRDVLHCEKAAQEGGNRCWIS